jgi:hypothetical protein
MAKPLNSLSNMCDVDSEPCPLFKGRPLQWPIYRPATTNGRGGGYQTDSSIVNLPGLKTLREVWTCASRQRKTGSGYGHVLQVEGGFWERAKVIPEIHDQWPASVAGALSAHKISHTASGTACWRH